MNKSIFYLFLGLIVVVIALLAILSVLGVITTDQAVDVGVKVSAILVIGMVTSLIIGMLNSSKKR